jgi:2,5-diketo-D-gluconate reductase A
MSNVPDIKLNDGTTIPQIGYGVWQVPDDEVARTANVAIAAGYRSIDTAAIYGNEAGTGAAVLATEVPRSELFVTTKLWNTEQGYDETRRAFDASLATLKLDYVDLYLIHWPVPAQDKYVATWRALEKIKGDGLARSIGVSNFQQAHLERLFAETGTVPSLNQIELHPNLPQTELREFHAKHGIVTEAWSPLGQGKLLDNSIVAGIAEQHGKSPAQVLLRWHLDLGNVVIPKSANPDRIRANIDVFDFDLTADDHVALAGLENGTRIGANPDTFWA